MSHWNPVGISHVVRHIEGKTERACYVSYAVLGCDDHLPSYPEAMIHWNPVGISWVVPHVEGKSDCACQVSSAVLEYVGHFLSKYCDPVKSCWHLPCCSTCFKENPMWKLSFVSSAVLEYVDHIPFWHTQKMLVYVMISVRPHSVTLIVFQGHSTVQQFWLKILRLWHIWLSLIFVRLLIASRCSLICH